MSFTHLHVHSEYSALDGMGKLKELILTAKEHGQSHIAITDHGSTSGLWEAQKLGESLGIGVLLGTEFYYQFEEDPKVNAHLVVLAKNAVGISNIFKMQEKAYVHNFYKKPRINWEILCDHAEGIVVTSACLGSSLGKYIMNGKMDDAYSWVEKFKKLFKDDFYLEIQPNSMPEQLLVNRAIVRIGKDLHVDIVASNDVHYVHETDAFAHEILLAMQFNKKMSDPKRWCFPVQDFWLKSEQEMFDTFEGLDLADVNTAIANTMVITEKCKHAKLEKGSYLPSYYNVGKKDTERGLLVDKVKEGMDTLPHPNTKEFLADVQHEINVICEEGYAGYFLIVADYVNTARSNGIPVGDGRGSGAGSKVAWLTGITKIAPHKYDLLFERFLSKGREPDFDVDFSDQDAVFTDLQKKYGVENVARIAAFGTLAPRAVCRKVLSTFEAPAQVLKQVSSMIPDLCPSMEEAYAASPELVKISKQYKTEFAVIERLAGIISHESQHAGGVIICKDLSSVLPIKTIGEDRSKRIVAFDMDMIHELGHFKFDILGLKTLNIVKSCLDNIEDSTGERIDLAEIDYEDTNVYQSLCNGDVSGVFQVSDQYQKIVEQAPASFLDLIAINALIRPGVGDWNEYIARRRGKQWDIHPERLPYLKETYGLLTYQEQFLLDAKTFAGWSIAFADKHIRKNKDIRSDTELRDRFLVDGLRRNYRRADLEFIWAEIVEVVAGGYGFNKSHSASYAMLTYQTAWLKTNFPVEYYAALMSSQKTDGEGQSTISGYVAECKKKKIPITPPDINHSTDIFRVVDGKIAYQITTIKHVGESAIKHINQLRPIKDFADFMERREKKHIKKNVLVNLIKAGCFDFDEPNRAELLWQVDMSERTNKQVKEGYVCDTYEWNDELKSTWEYDVLGMYLSLHPMEKYGFKPLEEYPDKGYCIQGGKIFEVKEITDKNNNKMAFVNISTLFGTLKSVVFAGQYGDESLRNLLVEGNVVMVKGRRDGNGILVNSIELLEEE